MPVVRATRYTPSAPPLLRASWPMIQQLLMASWPPHFAADAIIDARAGAASAILISGAAAAEDAQLTLTGQYRLIIIE